MTISRERVYITAARAALIVWALANANASKREAVEARKRMRLTAVFKDENRIYKH